MKLIVHYPSYFPQLPGCDSSEAITTKFLGAYILECISWSVSSIFLLIAIDTRIRYLLISFDISILLFIEKLLHRMRICCLMLHPLPTTYSLPSALPGCIIVLVKSLFSVYLIIQSWVAQFWQSLNFVLTEVNNCFINLFFFFAEFLMYLVVIHAKLCTGSVNLTSTC